jgi:flap endonuclease-1
MGVKGLMQLIADACPQALKETGAESYFGRKVALDASLALYSFLIALSPLSGSLLTNPSGDDTSYPPIIYAFLLLYINILFANCWLK